MEVRAEKCNLVANLVAMKGKNSGYGNNMIKYPEMNKSIVSTREGG
jgi:hypothetical protein